MQIAYFLPQHFFVSDHHPLHFQIGAARRQRGRHLLAYHQLRIVQILRSPHQVQQVASLDKGARRRHHQQLATLQPRTDDVVAIEHRHILNRHLVEVGVLHPHVNGVQMSVAVAAALLKPLGLFLHIDAEEQAHQPHGQQNAADAERIRHRVAHPHLIDHLERYAEIAQNLLPGPQRWRVGHRTGEDTEHHRERNIEQLMQHRGHQAAEDNDKDSEQIEPQA